MPESTERKEQDENPGIISRIKGIIGPFFEGPSCEEIQMDRVLELMKRGAVIGVCFLDGVDGKVKVYKIKDSNILDENSIEMVESLKRKGYIGYISDDVEMYGITAEGRKFSDRVISGAEEF